MEKTILILNTGGTLSSVMKENGLAPGLTTTDIQKELHMVSQGVNLEMQDFWSVDSANIFPEDWAALAGKIAAAIAASQRMDADVLELCRRTGLDAADFPTLPWRVEVTAAVERSYDIDGEGRLAP